MALPTSVRDAAITSCVEHEDLVIFVQNTFISVANRPSLQPRRRSASIPAGFKVATGGFIFDAEVKERGIASLPKVASMGAVSTATTVCWADSDVSSDFGSSAGSFEALPVIEEELDAGEIPPAGVGSSTSSRLQGPAPMCLCDLIAPPVIPRRPSLSSKARMFVSTSATTANSFSTKVDSMVASMRSAMSSMGPLVSISTTQASAGWSVCARLHAETRCASALLASAKCALVKGCEQSDNIYMLGYLAKPFVDTANGFAVTLCGMEDEEAACWDYYSKGACRRGCACKWAHPSYQVTVSVDLRC